jgi:hypothetical protein
MPFLFNLKKQIEKKSSKTNLWYQSMLGTAVANMVIRENIIEADVFSCVVLNSVQTLMQSKF